MKQLYILLFIFSFTSLTGQELYPSLAVSSHFSYTGLYLNVTPSISYGRAELYAGPKLAVSETRFPARGPVGLASGLILHTGCEGKINGFINPDYQYITFQSPSAPEQGENLKVHEIQIGFGLKFRISEKVDLRSAIYAGRYLEIWPGYYGSDRSAQAGYNSMIRIGANYRFVK